MAALGGIKHFGCISRFYRGGRGIRLHGFGSRLRAPCAPPQFGWLIGRRESHMTGSD
jgi:hypothetical protein